MSNIAVPRRSLILPRRFRRQQGGFIINPFAHGSSDPTAASIRAKLGSWWEMNEASGTRYDSVGTNHLTVVGTVSTGTGVRGGSDVAAAFTGAGGLTVASNTTLNVQTTTLTHCLFGWIYYNNHTGTQMAVAKWDASAAPYLDYAMSNQSGTAYAYNGGATYYSATGTPPSAGNWAFYVMWRDPADGKVRLQINNGAVTASENASAPSPTNGTSLGFGQAGSSASSRLNGRLQRFGYIKGAFLSATERTWLYNGGAGRTYAELAAA